jgi:broad specificity phosphatase PhoE
MKWPSRLVLVRHDVSTYNTLSGKKSQDPEYRQFLTEYKADPESLVTRALAEMLAKRWNLGVGDHDTPLVDQEGWNAQAVGAALRARGEPLPNVIFVSPYERTRDTLAGLKKGWPELEGVDVYEEERIREQEHGLSLLYNDWKIYCALHPEQRRLREIEGRYWYRFEQGENVPDVRARNRDFLGALVRDFSEQSVFVVSHHLNILAARANLERWGAKEFLAMDHKEKPINCGVTTYEGQSELGRNGRLVLVAYNEKLY